MSKIAPSSLNIRLLNKNDGEVYKKFRLDALRQNPEAFGPSYEEESKLSDVEFKKRLASCYMFGAFIEEQLVGCAGYYIIPLKKMSHRGELFFMHTNPKHRHRGIADALLKAVIVDAKNRITQLHLQVSTENPIANRLYEKNGFRAYGTIPRSIKCDGHYYDGNMMLLCLSDDINKKNAISGNMCKMVVDYEPSQTDNDIVSNGLFSSHQNIVGEKDKPVSIFLKNNAGNIVGGLLAFFDKKSIYIGALWVADTLRNQGFGKSLLDAAEREAIKHGCVFSTVDTWDFQAEEFYLKNGYVQIGEIKNYWLNHSKIFLRKDLK